MPDPLVFAVAVPGAPVPYELAWEEQRRLHARRVADQAPDTVMLLEHPPVFTAGKRTSHYDRPGASPGRPADDTPVIDVDRGGRITWHGPGQLVGYPILKLPEPLDVVAHVRRLEESLIAVCADLGLATQPVEGRSGVWVVDAAGARKVAAIGVRVAGGVSMHGFALNCDCDLSAYQRIVPCGISDAGVTSLSVELGRTVGVTEVLPLVRCQLAGRLGLRSPPAPVSVCPPLSHHPQQGDRSEIV